MRPGAWIGLALLACAGCSATYPTGTVIETVRDMCEREYGVAVDVTTDDKTVIASIPVEKLLQSDLSLSDRALDKIEDVMLTVSRVTLSSEFPYDFFVVDARDAETGVRVRFIRYVKDIRRLLTDDISRSDYFQRMLIKVDYGGGTTEGGVTTGEFLAAQIAQRLHQHFQLNLVAARLFHLAGVDGTFVPVSSPAGKTVVSGVFRLTLITRPGAPPLAEAGNPDLREDLYQLCFRTAQNLTRRYEFSLFDGLELVDMNGERLAEFPREEFTRDTVNTLMELIRKLRPEKQSR